MIIVATSIFLGLTMFSFFGRISSYINNMPYERDAVGGGVIAATTQETEASAPNGRGADLAFMPTRYKACPLPF
jgi:hypothetical protein